ncbi:proline-rich acidic protein 1 [Corvus moneduloides]|uniref:proline-rich acidic protein 1 n=1 Tax=Corvus moneduloides TaxID=1196302 RepID=UPI00136292D5|nr:proline-rich acidic protein 1 [Corvus moneduloides]
MCHHPEQQDLHPPRARGTRGMGRTGTWIHPVPPGTRGPGCHGAGQSAGQVWQEAAMDSPRAMGLCSTTVLLGTALLLLAPGSTQALSSSRWKDLAMEQDLAEEIILGVGAIETPEEGDPGIKVFSSSAWAQRGPPQVQAGPEEDRDHLHHPQDDTREANARVPFWMLSLEVQNGPEEDRDHLYHPQDDAREADTHRPLRMLSLEVQNGPEEDRDHIYHS